MPCTLHVGWLPGWLLALHTHTALKASCRGAWLGGLPRYRLHHWPPARLGCVCVACMTASFNSASTVCAGQAMRRCLALTQVDWWVEGIRSTHLSTIPPLCVVWRCSGTVSTPADSLLGAYECPSHTISWAVPMECMCMAMLCVHGWLLQPCWGSGM